jgi:class 3 adenylate cyclase
MYTFLAVFFSIIAVGVVVMPLVLDAIQKQYISIQADVNTRQAKAMAQFIQARVNQGEPKADILRDFQASIVGSNVDRGFVCLVDQKTTDFLCHPLPQLIGQSVAVRKAVYDRSFNKAEALPWQVAIKNPTSSSGYLKFPGPNNQPEEEVVHSQVIPSLGWVVNSHENVARINADIARIRLFLILGSIVFAFLLAFPISFAVRTVSRRYERQIEDSNRVIAEEKKKSDTLLLSILPEAIAHRMKEGEKTIVNQFDKVAILFCDIVGFTQYAGHTSPEKLVKLLNSLFSRFDALCLKHGVEKIKTIGDAYMAVCGLPVPVDDPVGRLAKMAFEMLDAVESLGLNMKVRIGLHVGEVVAGVIGTSKFSYDLWGDTVNLASRLESSGLPGKIHISTEVKQALGQSFVSIDRGETTLKGKGAVHTWFLERT